MCGIIGYVGHRSTTEVLLSGLSRLEYRGYDSAGVAVAGDGALQVIRAEGKLENLRRRVNGHFRGTAGLGHTRWATHGRPSEQNAHPHRDCTSRLVVVHNGIVENHLQLREQLSAAGHSFVSETDTEVIAHVLEQHYKGDLESAVQRALEDLEGVFAFAALTVGQPEVLVAARRGAPLVIGLGEDEAFVASDVPAFLSYTRDAVFLEDDELAVVRRGDVRIMDHSGQERRRASTRIQWDPIQVEKQGYRHFMLKEIHEQPRALRQTMAGRCSPAGRIDLDDLGLDAALAESLRRVTIVACGTSWHAGLVAKHLIERLARIPVEVDVASEFRYREPIIDDGTLVVGITQSGETADTLAALRLAKQQGAPTLAIVNVVGSMASRLADHVFYTQAGPEIGVASTKAFTAQLVALYMLALWIAQQRGALPEDQARERFDELARLGQQMDQVANGLDLEGLARDLVHARSCLYLGRGLLHPIALEGALKLKEISYIHAEGYAAGEMKHGPIALIDDEMPVVALALDLPNFDKIASNLQEAKARGARLVVVATQGDTRLDSLIEPGRDHVVRLPRVSEHVAPLLAVLPLQLISYHVAVARGCDVDQPRNLAKSVTVE